MDSTLTGVPQCDSFKLLPQAEKLYGRRPGLGPCSWPAAGSGRDRVPPGRRAGPSPTRSQSVTPSQAGQRRARSLFTDGKPELPV